MPAEMERSAPGDALPFPADLATLTRAAAAQMLELSGRNRSEAARRHGISRPRLQRLLDGLRDDDVLTRARENDDG
ncbi:MAG TPA: hypothetical protein VIV10_06575 [Gemmatimonadales bacterium]